MSRIIIPAVCLLCLTTCMPLGTPTGAPSTSKQIVYEDLNYEPLVGNVILNSTNPFTPLGGSRTIQLEFDLLNPEFQNLQARFVHCNYDWKPSKLPEMEYLKVYNQFNHKSFEYSINTKTKYIVYHFDLQKPVVSGNYLVVLHRRENPNDILFTRRLVVYDDKASVSAQLRLPNVVSQRPSHQQIDLELNYQGLEAPNPQENFKTVLMQNKNWYTAIKGLAPTGMQVSRRQMEWKYISGETTFPGWNQFRWLDLRTLTVRGMNVSQIVSGENSIRVIQGTDGQMGTGSYRQLIKDNNGRMIPGNSDPGEIWLEADYASVLFTLESEVRLSGRVYVTGRFNDWRKGPENLMQYDEERQVYFAQLRLKQGFYDYRYELDGGNLPVYQLEGSHFMAENEYDILVYYRAPGRINDEVVSLASLNSVNFF